MDISRRDFLKYVGASLAALGLEATQLTRLEEALAATPRPPVIWLSGAACTGCSVSLLNAVNPTIDEVLTNTVDLRYHSTVMAAAGSLAVQGARSTATAGGYILVVEGAIPTASGGRYCYVWTEGGRHITMGEAVRSLASSAKHVIAVGTCAAYGGVAKAYSTAGAKGVSEFLGRAVLNLPGCPTHPDWIVGTLVQTISGKIPALDGKGRPIAYYKTQAIHDRCPRRGKAEAREFGVGGLCLKALGCDGPRAHADCDLRLWNNKQNWCIGANGFCQACTEPSFPEFPLHKKIG